MNDPSTIDSLKQHILETKLSTRHPGEERSGLDIKEAAYASAFDGSLYVFTADHWSTHNTGGSQGKTHQDLLNVMLLKPTKISGLSVEKRIPLMGFVIAKMFGHAVKEVQGSNPKFNKKFTARVPKDSDIQNLPTNLEQALMKYVDKYPLKGPSFSLRIKQDGIFLQCSRPGSFAKLQDAIELTKNLAA